MPLAAAALFMKKLGLFDSNTGGNPSRRSREYLAWNQDQGTRGRRETSV